MTHERTNEREPDGSSSLTIHSLSKFEIPLVGDGFAIASSVESFECYEDKQVVYWAKKQKHLEPSCPTDEEAAAATLAADEDAVATLAAVTLMMRNILPMKMKKRNSFQIIWTSVANLLVKRSHS